MDGSRRRRASLLAVSAAGALLLAACGGSGGAGGPYGGGGGGGGNAGGSSSGGAQSPNGIATQKISGIGTVIDTSQGFTVYHLKTETGGQIMCTGSCTGIWPPLLANGSVDAHVGGFPGTFATISRPDGGTQLTYDGMPLYTYSGDTKPGEANGQGIQGVWFAVSPSGSNTPTSGSSGSGSSGGGRYGYG